MSVLSVLGSIGKGIGKAIPGIGPILSVIDAVSPVLGGAAKSGAQANQSRDLLKLQAENARLNRDKFALAAPGSRLSTAVRSSAALNSSPAVWDWGGPGSGLQGKIPRMTGGFAGALALDPRAKMLASRNLDDELMSQMRGGATGGGLDASMPNMDKIGQTSTLDKILGGGAFGTSILSALSKIKKGGGGGGGPINRYIPPDSEEM